MQFSPVLLFLSLAVAAAVPKEADIAKRNAMTAEANAKGIFERQGVEVAIAKPNVDEGLAPQLEKFINGPLITGEGAGGISK